MIHFFLRNFQVALFFFLLLLLPSAVLATMQADAETEVTTKVQDGPLTIGLAGQIRLGHWTPFFVELESDADRYEVVCPDSNGNQVVYSGRLQTSSLRPRFGEGCFRLGRDSGKLTFRFFNDDEVVDEKEYSIRELFNANPSTRQLILSVGDSPHQLSWLQSSFSDSENTIVVPLDDFALLPRNGKGLDSADLIMMNLTDTESAERFSATQLEALLEYVRDGGRLIIGIGPETVSAINNSETLQALIPGNAIGSTTLESSSRLNYFTNGRDELIERDGDPMSIADIEPVDAETLLLQGEQPLVIKAARGFGNITIATLDLESKRFVEWTDSGNFVRRLARGENVNNIEQSTAAGTRVTNYGYEDILGQLGVALDQFSKVGFISFTWVALLIGLFIICIGPLDYFILKKVFGRMELTWLTFSLLIIGFGALAYFGNQWSRPEEIQVNQLEIVDIDIATKSVRSSVWTNVFGPETRPMDISTRMSSSNFDRKSTHVGWHGLPGGGLGGMQSQTVTLADLNSRYQAASSESGIETLSNIPFQVSSSRAFFAQWRGAANFDIRNRLSNDTRLRSNERIAGTINNPLDIELKNCRVYFGDWVYVFEQPFGPGDTVDLDSEAREKNLKSYMTRRQTKENKGVNTPWDATETNLERIANMMMFFDAAGGAAYTSLTHDYQSFIDMSELLSLNRAILVGESSDRLTDIVVDGSDVEYDRNQTIYRFVIPVDAKAPSSNP